MTQISYGKVHSQEVIQEQFCFEVSNMFAALEDLDAGVVINSRWEIIR
jgi:hypothetical protein